MCGSKNVKSSWFNEKYIITLSQEFRLKNIDQTRNYFIAETMNR